MTRWITVMQSDMENSFKLCMSWSLSSSNSLLWIICGLKLPLQWLLVNLRGKFYIIFYLVVCLLLIRGCPEIIYETNRINILFTGYVIGHEY